MPYMEKIGGSRVFLSPVDPGDMNLYIGWINDPGVGVYNSFITGNGMPYEGFMTALREGRDDFAIISRVGGTPIGLCGMMDLDGANRTAELYINIGEPDYRGGGYGTEAMNLLLDFCFRVRNLHSARLRVFAYNKRAVASYKKCGFRETGLLREALRIAGRRHDVLLMDKLAPEHKGAYLDEYFD